MGRFGAYRVFLEYSYLSSAAVYSQGKPMPSLQSLAGTRGEDTDHIKALFVCWCALPPQPPPPLPIRFKENYIVLFMEDNSINSGALMLRATLMALLPPGPVLPAQSSLLTSPYGSAPHAV